MAASPTRPGSRSTAPGRWRRSSGPPTRINIEFTGIPISINGLPGARLDIPFDGSTTALSFVVEDGRITRIYAMRNPHKLQRLGEETSLQR